MALRVSSTQLEFESIHTDIRHLQEFGVKGAQTAIQDDIKSLKETVAKLSELVNKVQVNTHIPRTSEERFKASTDRLTTMDSKLEPPKQQTKQEGTVPFQNQRLSQTPFETTDRDQVHRIINQKDYPKNDQFPRFSGEGTYDLYGFINKLEMIKKDFIMVDQTILARMSLILEGEAALWYETQREEYDVISWEDFKAKLVAEYDTLNWRKRVAQDFDRDKFFPENVLSPSQWVTRQCRRMKILDKNASHEEMINKLMIKVPGSLVNHIEARTTTGMTISEFSKMFVNLVENSDLPKEVRRAKLLPNRFGGLRSQDTLVNK